MLRFSVRIIALIEAMAKDRVGNSVRQQLLRSGTSIGANYHEAQRAESRNDFIHKVELSTKEAAETVYWLELINESPDLRTKEAADLLNESRELLAILCAIGRSAKKPPSAPN